MREIKFRGKKKDNEEWIYGLLVKNIKGDLCIQEEKTDAKFKIVSEVIPETIGQFTGVYDDYDYNDEYVESKEIYENDTLKFRYEDEEYVGEVAFEAGAFTIVCGELPDHYIALLEIKNYDRDYCWIDGRVIGNIHDNPESLRR